MTTHASSKNVSTRYTLLPASTMLRAKLLRRFPVEITAIADRSWEIAPGESTVARQAYFLPGQLERVKDIAYTKDFRREMTGKLPLHHNPTRGFLIKDAVMVDGAIYKANAWHWLHRRTTRFPKFRIDEEIERAALYSTADGIAFFGLWLEDDCVTYPLALNEGIPLTSDHVPLSAHMLTYEDWLEMRPARFKSVYIRELVLFDDAGQTRHKRARFRSISNKLLSKVKAEPHPGVFILRRDSGKSRIMANELELAESLRSRRGFRVVDVTKDDVPSILAACAGARVVAGVEGSHLVHGIMMLKPGMSVLTLQPPHRFCSVIKRTTDPDNQHYGFVVGQAHSDGFSVDLDEVERTLDLLPKPPTN